MCRLERDSKGLRECRSMDNYYPDVFIECRNALVYLTTFRRPDKGCEGHSSVMPIPNTVSCIPQTEGMKGSKGLLLLGEPSFLLFQALILAPYPKGARQGWKERAFEARNKLCHPLTAKVVSPSQRTKGEELPQVLTRTARPLRSENQHARACGRIRCDEKLFNSEV